MTRIAVVQPALELGEVERNLVRMEDLIRDAHREHGAEVVVVPEAFTTPNVYAKVLRGAARPVDGQPLLGAPVKVDFAFIKDTAARGRRR